MNRITPLILAVALFMEMMDSTVIATSLPAIAADIGTEPIALKLAMTAYLVSLAIFIPVSGWMADRFGARNVFRWAIFIFMVGSVACAVSNSLESFVGARFLQGMGGSMMTPLARLVLVRATPKKDLVEAMAWLSVPALVGPISGPPIGGFLTTYFSWHWIFLINIPIGIAGIILSTIYLPEIPRQEPQKLDWWGFVLAATACSGILFGLSVVSLPALPPAVGLVTCATGAIALAMYLVHASRVPLPILNLAIFKYETFAVSVLGGSLFRIGIGATPFLMPLLLQLGFGYNPFESGLITLFGAAGAIFAKSFTRRLYVAFGFRQVMLTGAALSAILLAVMGLFNLATPVWVIILVMLVSGVIRSTFFTGTNAMAFADLPDNTTGQATALSSVAQQISLACGVAIGGGALELIHAGSSSPLTFGDFRLAFFVVAVVGLTAVIPFAFLNRDAGSNVSGHGKSGADPDDPTGLLSGK